MAFQTVATERQYVGYKDMAPNTVCVEGWYIGTSTSKYNHPVWHFRTAEGKAISLNSAGHLDYSMETHAKEGDYCKVTYLGKKLVTSGAMKGKEAYNFRLEIDPDRFNGKPPANTDLGTDMGMPDEDEVLG